MLVSVQKLDIEWTV